MKTIKITIETDGKTNIETAGFTGKSCKDATAELERALGKSGNVKKKSEYYKKSGRTINVRN